MATEHTQSLPPPPGVMNALKAGMDAIASRLSILLLPLALDLLLWFGPRVSVQRLFSGVFEQALALGASPALPAAETEAVRQALAEWLSRYNLLGVLRTFPVGVSSLMTAKLPLKTPLGIQAVIEVGSAVSLMGWLFLLIFLGWMAGGLYFRWVSGAAGNREGVPTAGRAVAQTLLFSLLLTALAFLFGLPAIMVLGLIGLFSPALMQAAFFALALFSAWLIVPLFFAPHGMYLRGQNAFYSIYASLRMARFTLPSSSMFVLAVFVISQGLNYLWMVPADDSWMLLVGIAGHAFVTTALLAASFIYYRDMNAWLEIVFQRLKPNTAAPQT